MTTGKLFVGREDTFDAPRGSRNEDSTKSETVCLYGSSVKKLVKRNIKVYYWLLKKNLW